MNVTIYTIHVGFAVNGSLQAVDTNRVLLLSILYARHPNGFTVFDRIGYFKGNEEPGASVVIIDDGSNESFIKETALLIKGDLCQDEVWLTSKEEKLEIIS